MRSFKMFGVLLAVLAFSAIGVASASASTFTAEETGALTGEQTTNQVFIAGGEVVCKKAVASGTITATASESQKAKVAYSECSAYGIVGAHVTPEVEYEFTANGTAHLLNEVTITVTKTIFTSHCTIHIPAQTNLGGITYTNTNGHITLHAHVENIKYVSTGPSPCPASGTYTNGTYKGSTTVFGPKGTSWDA